MFCHLAAQLPHRLRKKPCLVGAGGRQQLTRIVSSPITSISHHLMTISSSRPKMPKKRGRPYTMIESSLAVQVSSSASQTPPRRIPSLMLMTSLLRRSARRQTIPTTFLSQCLRQRIRPPQKGSSVKTYAPSQANLHKKKKKVSASGRYRGETAFRQNESFPQRYMRPQARRSAFYRLPSRPAHDRHW